MGQFAISDGTNSLNAVTATGNGSTIVGNKYSGYTIFVRATGVTTGGTVKIDVCDTDSSTQANWCTIATVNVTANGTQTVLVDGAYPYIRANLSARTDGTYTVKIMPWIGYR